MNAHRAHRLPSRTRGLALTGSVLLLLAMFCLQFTRWNRAAWQAVLEPGPASLDEALAALCGSTALALILWLMLALLLSVVAALGAGSPAAGAALAGCARAIAPAVLRNTVAAVLGVAISAAPAAAGAVPAPSAPALTTTQSSTLREPLAGLRFSSPWVPLEPSAAPSSRPDRPPGTSLGSRTGAARADLLPGWRPDRPRAPRAGPAPARRGAVDREAEVVVRRGDTLWSLAERHLGPGASNGEIAAEWPHWFTANRAVIGNDPDHLVPGERLRPPDRDQRTATGSRGRR